MLVLPAISVWTARRFDRSASEEVAANHNAESERAGRYNKCLINVKAPSYVALKKIEGEARRYHERMTLPWSQDGARILSATAYQDYTTQMLTYKESFSHAVYEFRRAYPGLVDAAEKELNGLFRASDYPDERELSEKFSFRVSVLPIPDANDFRVEELSDADIDKIRGDIEQEVQQAFKVAEQEKWSRLMEVVSRAVERLSSPDVIFRDSLIGNIKDAVQTLPKLALTKDENFDIIIEEVRAKLAVCEPSVLREDPNARASAARKAAEIMKKMSAYMPPAP